MTESLFLRKRRIAPDFFCRFFCSGTLLHVLSAVDRGNSRVDEAVDDIDQKIDNAVDDGNEDNTEDPSA